MRPDRNLQWKGKSEHAADTAAEVTFAKAANDARML
jgi:hypothetical protein